MGAGGRARRRRQPAPRQTGPQRVSGIARYTVDVALPGMLHAAVLRSPVAHGRVRRCRSTRPSPSPASARCSGPRPSSASRSAPARCTREPDYAGAPIAVVAADTLAAARAGVRALALEIDPLPFVVDIEAAFRDQRIDGDPFEDTRGDVDAALAAAEVSVELQVETPGSCRRRSNRTPRSPGGSRTS